VFLLFPLSAILGFVGAVYLIYRIAKRRCPLWLQAITPQEPLSTRTTSESHSLDIDAIPDKVVMSEKDKGKLQQTDVEMPALSVNEQWTVRDEATTDDDDSAV